MPYEPAGSPEQTLIARAIRGDAEAFGQLYDRYLQPIYGFIYYQVTNVQEAEDLTEIVFIKAFEKLPDFRTAKKMENFRAWLYRIARNTVIDHYRTAKPLTALDPEFPLASGDAGPEERIQMDETVGRIRSALLEIDELYRQVIVLRFIQELNYAETSAALGLTENYIRVIQFRALRKLREQIDRDENDWSL